MKFVSELLQSALGPLAGVLHSILPDWVRLPSLTFELPHLVYWVGLAAFPLIALYLLRRERTRRTQERISYLTAYMFLITGGFAGLHRFYLRAAWGGVVLVVLFLLLLFTNTQAEDARNRLSDATNQFKIVEFDVERFGKQVKEGEDDAKPKLAEAQEKLIEVRRDLAAAKLVLGDWRALAGFLVYLIALILLVDLARVPRLVARCRELEKDAPPPKDFKVMERGPKHDPRQDITNAFSRGIDRVSGAVGTFIAWWALLAVYAYYYEVIARYVFNSPTNWAHESMFIMFGMQYVLAGAYAYREDAHVRVDVLYEMLSVRWRAVVDLITSLFFFVFAVTLVVSSWSFALQAMPAEGRWETSFTEWQLQYWPAKIAIFVGGVLLLFQGFARFLRDLIFLSGAWRTPTAAEPQRDAVAARDAPGG